MKLSKNLSDEKAAEIAQQQYFDLLKHITTLDTGTILLFAAFLEKVFTNPKWKLLIAITFVFLGASIVASVFTMIFQTFAFEDGDVLNQTGSTGYVVTFLVAVWGFVFGILCFSVFAIRNFY